MSWKRDLAETLVQGAALFGPSSKIPSNPRRIFVLRNNDLGDLLVITPLFEALKRRFPQASIIAGIGAWSCPILKNNPFVDEIFPLTAPWHNKMISGQTDAKRLGYCLFSPEVAAMRSKGFDIGIDVLGSPFGSLLMMRAGIPYRLGVRGYAGGHTGCQDWVESDSRRYVGRHALVFAELLGMPEEDIPSVKPQLYLDPSEISRGEELWSGARRTVRLVVGFGGGFPEKCWPLDHFRKLLELFQVSGSHCIKLVGGPTDKERGDALASGLSCVENLAGKVSLRDTFALTARAHQVMTNPSLLMHVAAAFSIPAVVSMGPFFPSIAEHNALWICTPRTTVLGVESGDGAVATPRQVFDCLLVSGIDSLKSYA
jgi:ADP-heptose:LPS heptosyltransferase